MVSSLPLITSVPPLVVKTVLDDSHFNHVAIEFLKLVVEDHVRSKELLRSDNERHIIGLISTQDACSLVLYH